jgi:hypothetical protein
MKQRAEWTDHIMDGLRELIGEVCEMIIDGGFYEGRVLVLGYDAGMIKIQLLDELDNAPSGDPFWTTSQRITRIRKL